MAAWMHACASVATATGASTVDRGESDTPMLPTTQRAVVDVLAAMVLTIAPEVTA
jgi:hypothetical protein